MNKNLTINDINLNLLKVFLVLMQERSVTLAAQKMFITQPAVSSSLNQLRELFNDELFIRGRGQIIPTQKAYDVFPLIKQSVSDIGAIIFSTAEFEYKTSTRIFKIAMTDYMEFVLLPSICAYIDEHAPNISLEIVNFREFIPELFENGKLELGIGLDRKLPKEFASEFLFDDGFLCIANKYNPILSKPWTLETYLDADHIASNTTIYNGAITRIELALQKLELTRKIKIKTSNILPSFQIVANSSLIGTFSKNVVTKFAPLYNLEYLLPPFDIPKISSVQVWHRQNSNDPGLLWLRKIIKNICNNM